MSPCYCSSCDKSLRLPLARLYKEAVQTELLTFAVAVPLDTSPRPTMVINFTTCQKDKQIGSMPLLYIVICWARPQALLQVKLNR